MPSHRPAVLSVLDLRDVYTRHNQRQGTRLPKRCCHRHILYRPTQLPSTSLLSPFPPCTDDMRKMVLHLPSLPLPAKVPISLSHTTDGDHGYNLELKIHICCIYPLQPHQIIYRIHCSDIPYMLAHNDLVFKPYRKGVLVKTSCSEHLVS